MHRHEFFRLTLMTILTCLLGVGTRSMALANACSIVAINGGELDMLALDDPTTLAEQCHEVGDPLLDDPCDVPLFYRPGGLIVNIKTSQAEYAQDRRQ